MCLFVVGLVGSFVCSFVGVCRSLPNSICVQLFLCLIACLRLFGCLLVCCLAFCLVVVHLCVVCFRLLVCFCLWFVCACVRACSSWTVCFHFAFVCLVGCGNASLMRLNTFKIRCTSAVLLLAPLRPAWWASVSWC